MTLKRKQHDVSRWAEEGGSPDAGPEWYLRQQVVCQTEDQSEIAEVARNDPDSHVRIVALLKLTDPSLVEEIGRLDSDETVRAVASLCASRLVLS